MASPGRPGLPAAEAIGQAADARHESAFNDGFRDAIKLSSAKMSHRASPGGDVPKTSDAACGNADDWPWTR
jgi:hypothetical protein